MISICMLLTYLILFADKNYKETFMKKINLCMKTYDYKDETKDVKGKVSLISRTTFCKIELMSCFCQFRPRDSTLSLSFRPCSRTRKMW